MSDAELVAKLMEQAPAVGAVLVVVVVFLRHIRAEARANREVLAQLTEALVQLRLELRDRKH